MKHSIRNLTDFNRKDHNGQHFKSLGSSRPKKIKHESNRHLLKSLEAIWANYCLLKGKQNGLRTIWYESLSLEHG